MQLRSIALSFSIAAFSCGAVVQAQQPPRQAPAVTSAVTLERADLTFLLDFAQFSRGMLRAAQLGESSSDARVQRVARSVRKSYGTALAQLQRIADSKNVALTPRPDWAERAMLDGLRGVMTYRDGTFERHFIDTVGLDAQRESVARLHSYLSKPGSANPELMALARDFLPEATDTLSLARSVNAQWQQASGSSS